MATYNFSSLIGTTVASFAVATDTLAILNTGSEVTLADSSNGLVVTTAAGSVTLTGVTLAQVTSTNITINGGSVLVGDNTTNAIFDIAGNTINAAGSGSNLVYGLGGGDTITVGDGSNVVFGGTGSTDTTDGGDVFTLGTGSNTVYGNAGDDAVSFTTTMLAAKTNTIYLGLGNDTINSPGAGTSTSSLVIYGGSGNDSLNGAAFVGDVTVFGGVGASDSTDGADTMQFGTGGIVASFNAGNDTITGGATISGKTGSYNLGVGDDTFTAGNAVGNSTITGAQGTDTITVNGTGGGDVTIYGGTGTTDSTDGADTITGGANFAGNLTIYANAGNDVLTNIAVDTGKTATIYAGLGTDTVTLLTQAPTAGVSAGSYLIELGAGANDTLNAAFNANVADVVVTDFETGDLINVTLSAGASTALNVTGNGSAIVIFTDVGANGYTVGTDERITLSSTTANLTATNFVLSDGSKVITNFSSTATTLASTAAVDYLISGSAADTFTGSVGNNDKFEGNGGNDVFNYTTAILNAWANGSTVNGGDGTDTITQSDAGNITLDVSAAMGNVTNVEKITFASGNHAITSTGASSLRPTTFNFDANAVLTTVSFNQTNMATAVTVDGDGATSTGAMTVVLATNNNVVLTAGGSDAITLGTGNDSVVAGSGDDTFTTATANWTSSDTLAGGVGTNDRIVLTNAATIVDSNFSNVTGVEQVVLTGLAQSVTLGTAASAAGLTALNGSATTGVNTVNAASMTTGILITGGTAADSLTGGSGADTLYGGIGATVDTLVGGAGVDHYAFTANGTANAVDSIASTDFVVGASGDIFNFKLNATTFTNIVTEGIITHALVASATTAQGATAVAAYVFTADSVGTAADLQTALNLGDLDTATFGSRVVVWEINATSVGVGVLTNSDNGAGTTDDTTVTQVATISGFANQAATDAFTVGLTSANFDFI